jgi:hypothetical protein
MAGPGRPVILRRSMAEGPQHPQQQDEACEGNNAEGPRRHRQLAKLPGPCAGQRGNCGRERHGHSVAGASSQRSVTDLAVALDNPLGGGQLGQTHRSASVQLLGGDADLGAKPELPAIGEPR